VDFRVWQADASLDGVLALLRKFDIAITMRFHATIFALSQNCKVIGVDYRIGKKDKVAGLMDEFGQGENCARIDLLTDDWLAKKLEELISNQTSPSFFSTHFMKDRSANSAPRSQEKFLAREDAASESFSRRPGSSKKRNTA